MISNAELLRQLTYADAVQMFQGAGPEYWIIPAITKYLAPQAILELGTEYGMSARMFRAAAPTARITSIDVNDACAEFIKDLNIEFICAPSEQAAETWGDEVDLLFIDTEHTYEQCTKELNSFAKFVKRAIICHDICSFPDIDRAIKDWIATNPQWQYAPYAYNFGMGVLWRNNEEAHAGV